jgi:hypothetical protein
MMFRESYYRYAVRTSVPIVGSPTDHAPELSEPEGGDTDDHG